jgi:hypothetical protein
MISRSLRTVGFAFGEREFSINRPRNFPSVIWQSDVMGWSSSFFGSALRRGSGLLRTALRSLEK